MLGKPKLAFYGNNSDRIGAGHIMRLFSLAEVACKEFDITFVYKNCSSPLLNKISKAGFSSLKVTNPFQHNQLKELGFVAIFVDDYEFSTTEWLGLNSLDIFVIKLDDAIDSKPILADLVINPAPNFSLEQYQQRAPDALFCLGPKYTYLRQEFALTSFQEIEHRNDILITLGGTDSKSLALPLSIAITKALPECYVKLLVGKQHQDHQSLELLSQQNNNFSICIDPPSVAELMVGSGLAISAAGGTLGELASQGVPTVALITVDNQLQAMNSHLVDTWYTAFDIRTFDEQQGNHSTQKQLSNQMLIQQVTEKTTSLWHDKCLRQYMSDYARQLIDSEGCQRIINKLVGSLKRN